MNDENVLRFIPASGRDLIQQAREARVVPRHETRARMPSFATMNRSQRLRAVAGVAAAMLVEARQVFTLIAAGATPDGPLSLTDMQQLAELGLKLANHDTLAAMVDDIEALHGR